MPLRQLVLGPHPVLSAKPQRIRVLSAFRDQLLEPLIKTVLEAAIEGGGVSLTYRGAWLTSWGGL